jgi:imidazolonepropionase-like amidohydrolase
VAAGRFIAMTGGHAWEWARQADGADDVRRATREQIRAGAQVIKLMATGGLSTPGSPYAPELTVDELRAGVEEAHKARLQAAAYAHNSAGISAALAAGIDSIEHAALVDDAEISAMVEAGVVLVPTLVAVTDIRPGAGLDPDVVPKTEAARRIFFERIQRAIRAGVRLAAGTDAGTALNPIGRVVNEIQEYHRLGADILTALRAATVVAGTLIGEGVGVIREGAVADLIVTTDDPREDLSALRSLRAVIARGRPVDLAWLRQTVSALPGGQMVETSRS